MTTGSEIAWIENTGDASASYPFAGNKLTISFLQNYAGYIAVTDFDGDGYRDVVWATNFIYEYPFNPTPSARNPSLTWSRGTSSNSGAVFVQSSVLVALPSASEQLGLIATVDVNGDGLTDVVGVSVGGSTLLWVESRKADYTAASGAVHIIASNPSASISDIVVADVDSGTSVSGIFTVYHGNCGCSHYDDASAQSTLP